MKTCVQKWGNSLAVRIPKPLVDDMLLEQGSLVDIWMANGAIVIKPVVDVKAKLEQILSRVSEENLHGEIDTGLAVGAEVW